MLQTLQSPCKPISISQNNRVAWNHLRLKKGTFTLPFFTTYLSFTPQNVRLQGALKKRAVEQPFLQFMLFHLVFTVLLLCKHQNPLHALIPSPWTCQPFLPQDSGQVPSHRQRHLHGLGRTYPPPSAPLYPAFPDKRHVINEGNHILIQCLPAADAVRKEHHIVDTQK